MRDDDLITILMRMVAAAAPSASPSAVTRIATADDVMLAVERHGEPDRPAVVFAHGFGQTRLAWRGVAQALPASGWQALSYDARGHGDSDRLASGDYAVDQLVADLHVVCALVPSPPVVVGASMGGLVGIAAAGGEAPPCRALVLVDVTPRWEAAGVARILGFMRAHPDGFADLEEAAETVARYLPHRTERKSPERLRGLLTPSPDGRLRWHWDPRMLGPIAEDAERHQGDLFAAARRLAMPVLLVTGSASDVVSPATIAEFLEFVPHAKHVEVPRATHMVAGDENTAFARHVMDFLQALPA